MSRLLPIIIVVLLITFAASAVYAQETPPQQPPDLEDLVSRVEDAAQRVETAAIRAESAAARAESSAQEAGNAFDTANSLFGLFEAMSGAVGLVVPFLAIVGGLIGFRRLESAQSELREARERFERDIREREMELDAMRIELEATAQHQREAASKSSLALALLPLGERQYRAQDYTGALDTYQRALALDPNNPITHYRMGYVYTQSGKFEEADRHLARSLELDPEFAPSLATRGYVYRRMGDAMDPGIDRDITYNQAEEHFLKALKLFPKLMDEDGESWWGSLGGLYRRRGQIRQAIYAYERCTEVTPHSSYPFSNLALLYMETQNREKMMETYKRVEQLASAEVLADVDNYWAYADLIVSRLALGKVKQVEDILERAVATAPPDSPYTLDSLIDTLSRLSSALRPEERPPVEHVMAYIQAYKAQRETRKQEL